MTGSGVPPEPSVLDTTVLSNFAYIDRVDLLVGLSGICAVPVVRTELRDGVDDHPYLGAALDRLNDGIPVAPISETLRVVAPESRGGAHEPRPHRESAPRSPAVPNPVVSRVACGCTRVCL